MMCFKDLDGFPWYGYDLFGRYSPFKLYTLLLKNVHEKDY